MLHFWLISGDALMKILVPGRLTPVLLFVFAVLLQVHAVKAQSTEPALMPMPMQMEMGDGHFPIDGKLSIALAGYSEPRLALAKERFFETLGRETGIPFQHESTGQPSTFTITTSGPSKDVQELGEDESYHLKIWASGVRLTAANPLGVLHGLQTFLQLVKITPQGFAVPVVTIYDNPRFAWRGLMIDSGRHFMPVEVIERNLDGMEAVKLNVFHWHLSEDQGFRVESKVFPQLQEKGSNGLYYTQKQIAEVIEYARDRGIRVVPEFDMPCHTTSWFVGYPQLASGAGPYQIQTRWGIFDYAMDPTRESTFEFLDRFLGEMTALFPDAYFHIGGDECNGKEWDANPRIQAYMKQHGLKDDAALQATFTERIQKLVVAHHKIPEGWDEILQPDTARDVVIQSWRGQKGLATAARQGNRALLSNGYYIDLNQSAAYHYSNDPLGGDGASLTAEQKALVLGGEATMWSEFVTPENIDSRIWPRTAAIAERLWSPQEVRDVDSMYRRLAVVSQHLQYYSLNHESFTLSMLQRMSGESDPRNLQVLADVVQPPEGYQRESLKQYDTSSPLNRLVDAVPPESEQARQFNELVKQIVAGKATPEQWQQARAWLVLWRDNDARLQPSLSQSEITAELVPLSHDLSEVATIGLRALDDLQNHGAANPGLVASNMQLLKAAEKPEAVLRNMIVPPVEMLLQATGSR
jgi:hexosaminidase